VVTFVSTWRALTSAPTSAPPELSRDAAADAGEVDRFLRVGGYRRHRSRAEYQHGHERAKPHG
jgi:hypothetical protein